jgi:DNA-binding GntR family transcriptional regulator
VRKTTTQAAAQREAAALRYTDSDRYAALVEADDQNIDLMGVAAAAQQSAAQKQQLFHGAIADCAHVKHMNHSVCSNNDQRHPAVFTTTHYHTVFQGQQSIQSSCMHCSGQR